MVRRTFDLDKYLTSLGAEKTGNDHEVHLDCPNCGDEKGHLYFNLSRKVGNCKKCAFSPTLVGLIMAFEDLDFSGALRFLKAHTVSKVQKKFGEQILYNASLPEGFASLSSLDKIPRYARERGVTRQVAEEFGIGFTRIGYYAWHLIFPVLVKGELRGFVARRMSDNGKRYLYPKGFKTSEVLYRLDNVKGDECVLVEGVFDCIPLKNEAAALLGSSLSKEHLRMLLQRRFSTICLALDPEASAEVEKIGKRLSPYFDVRVADLGYGDPGSRSREGMLEIVNSLCCSFQEWEYNYFHKEMLDG